MPWAAVAGAALTGIASYAKDRQHEKAAAKETKAQFRSDQYFSDLERHRQLEDRRYKEEAISPYRQYGAPGLMSPAYTDPGPMPEDPYAPKPKATAASDDGKGGGKSTLDKHRSHMHRFFSGGLLK